MASYVYLSNKQELTYAHAIVEIGTIPIEESNTNLPEPRALINKRLVNILLSSNSVLKPVVEQSSGDDLSIASLRKRITVSTVHPYSSLLNISFSAQDSATAENTLGLLIDSLSLQNRILQKTSTDKQETLLKSLLATHLDAESRNFESAKRYSLLSRTGKNAYAQKAEENLQNPESLEVNSFTYRKTNEPIVSDMETFSLVDSLLRKKQMDIESIYRIQNINSLIQQISDLEHKKSLTTKSIELVDIESNTDNAPIRENLKQSLKFGILFTLIIFVTILIQKALNRNISPTSYIRHPVIKSHINLLCFTNRFFYAIQFNWLYTLLGGNTKWTPTPQGYTSKQSITFSNSDIGHLIALIQSKKASETDNQIYLVNVNPDNRRQKRQATAINEELVKHIKNQNNIEPIPERPHYPHSIDLLPIEEYCKRIACNTLANNSSAIFLCHTRNTSIDTFIHFLDFILRHRPSDNNNNSVCLMDCTHKTTAA